jgi:hypothetical protein
MTPTSLYVIDTSKLAGLFKQRLTSAVVRECKISVTWNHCPHTIRLSAMLSEP